MSYDELAEIKSFAEKGSMYSQSLLGTFYYNGTSVPRNYEEAVKWFTLAAKQGHADSQYYLESA